MSTLFIVATPIGNLGDFSPRAQQTLREVRIIAAEDTRQSGVLLKHFDIGTPMISYHEHNETKRIETILEKLSEGDVALISDAGTPAINDPGYPLVRAAIDAGHTITPIPGPSAPITALSASGLPTDSFLYLGYLKRKTSERIQQIEAVKEQPYTLIFLETPHRLADALDDLLAVLGDRQICIGREMTKLYEEFIRGSLSDVIHQLRGANPKGEVTLVIEGHTEPAQWSRERLNKAVNRAIERGESPSRAARELARDSGWPRRMIYDMLVNDGDGSDL